MFIKRSIEILTNPNLSQKQQLLVRLEPDLTKIEDIQIGALVLSSARAADMQFDWFLEGSGLMESCNLIGSSWGPDELNRAV